MERSIIVPWDFTEVANYALEHAYFIGKVTNRPVYLIHVTNKESKIEELQKQMQEVADKFMEGKEISVTAVVRKGKLTKELISFGEEVNAYLAVMGTHGISTIGKAMKIVKKFVKMPFILVQGPVFFGEYDRICVPIDDNKKSRIKMQWVRYLSNLFESKVFIISPTVFDGWKVKNLNNNLRFAEKQMQNNLIEFEFKKIEPGQNFAEAIYDYMRDVEADLVLMMTTKYKEYIKNLKKPDNKELYKKIPIMCVNPRTDIQKLGGFN
jgi:hypothetical protein